MRLQKLLALVFCFFTLTQAAYAQSLTEEGAAELKKAIDNYLAVNEDIFGSMGLQYVYEGETQVEISDEGYYAATSPHAKLVHTASETEVTIGIIAINAKPGGQPNDRRMTFALPTPIFGTNATGEKIFSLSLGSQSYAGYYSDEMGYFPFIDAALSDLVLEDFISANTITLGQMIMKQDFKKNAEGLYSGPTDIIFDDFKWKSNADKTAGQTPLSIGQIALKAHNDGFDMQAYKAVSDRLNQFYKENGDALATGDEQAEQELLAQIFNDKFFSFFGNFEMDITLSDFVMTRPNAETASSLLENTDQIKIENLSYGFGLSKNDSGESVFSMRAASKHDVGMLPFPEDLKPFIAGNVGMDIDFINFPMTEFMAFAEENVDPENPQSAAGAAMFQLPQLLSDAGFRIVINDFSINSR